MITSKIHTSLKSVDYHNLVYNLYECIRHGTICIARKIQFI